MVKLIQRIVCAVAVAVFVLCGSGVAGAQDPPPEDDRSFSEQFIQGGTVGDQCREITGGLGLDENIGNVGCSIAGVGATLGTGAVGAVINNGPAAAGAAAGAAGDVIEEKFKSAAGEAFDGVVQSAAEGMGSALIWCMTLWINIPTAYLPENAPPSGADFIVRREASEATQTGIFSRIQDYTLWIQIILLAASVVAVAGRMALARRASASMEEAQSALMAGARVVLASVLVGTVVIAAARAGDNFSQWVIDEATQGNPPAQAFENIARVLTGESAAQALGVTEAQGAAVDAAAGAGTAAVMSPGTIAMIVLILAIIGIIGMIVMVGFVILRQIFLIFIVAFMPMAAAASGMQFGREAWSKMLGWTIALLLFKPVGALAIAVGLWIGQSSDPVAQLMGLLILVMSWLILPSIMKLVVPATAQAGLGPSSAAIGGAVMGTAVGVGMKAAGAMAGGAGGAASAGSGSSAGTANMPTGGKNGGGGSPPPPPPPPPPPSSNGPQNNSGGAAGGRREGAAPVSAGPAGGQPSSQDNPVNGASSGTAQNYAGEHLNPTPSPRNGNEIDP